METGRNLVTSTVNVVEAAAGGEETGSLKRFVGAIEAATAGLVWQTDFRLDEESQRLRYCA
jgi:hypothetical protein